MNANGLAERIATRSLFSTRICVELNEHGKNGPLIKLIGPEEQIQMLTI